MHVQGSLRAAHGASLELAVADITKVDSLQADLFQGVRAVICCTAVNVSPKEGDTPNRDKYKQVGSSWQPLHVLIDSFQANCTITRLWQVWSLNRFDAQGLRSKSSSGVFVLWCRVMLHDCVVEPVCCFVAVT